VQRKGTGEVVGYCKLDEVQSEMLQLEKVLTDAADEVSSAPLKAPPIAKRMLSYLVKGVGNDVQNVVASYTVSSLTKEEEGAYTWEVTEMLELHGIRVIAWGCDGCPVNRGVFDMQPPAHPPTASGIVFATVNRYAPYRWIYFISDVAHLLKTIRNCYRNRRLFKNGEFIEWRTIVRLFRYKEAHTTKSLYKLTAACVFLNPYSLMNVSYAARVMSESVANFLELKKWPGTKETCF